MKNLLAPPDKWDATFTCPTSKFTCPGQSDKHDCWALLMELKRMMIFIIMWNSKIIQSKVKVIEKLKFFKLRTCLIFNIQVICENLVISSFSKSQGLGHVGTCSGKIYHINGVLRIKLTVSNAVFGEPRWIVSSPLVLLYWEADIYIYKYHDSLTIHVKNNF